MVLIANPRAYYIIAFYKTLDLKAFCVRTATSKADAIWRVGFLKTFNDILTLKDDGNKENKILNI